MFIKTGKKQKDDFIGDIVALIIVVLIIFVGGYVFFTKMAGNRSLEVVEGVPAQITGAFFICFGLYNLPEIISKIKNRTKKKKRM